MAPALIFDLKRCLMVVVAGLALGWAFDNVAFGVALGLAVLLARQLHGAWSLHRWLRDRSAALPRGHGLLGDIEHHLDRVQRQARKRKKRLSKVVR